jgi:hypothetical protein
MSMSVFRSRSVVACALLLLAAVSASITLTLWPSTPSEAQGTPWIQVKPVSVGNGSQSRGVFKPNNAGTDVSFDTNNDGEFWADVKNTTGGNRNDLHFKIKSPAGATIKIVESKTPLDDISAAGPGSEVGVKTGNSQGSGPVANDASQQVQFEVRNAQGGLLALSKVKLDIWWTQNTRATVFAEAKQAGDVLLSTLDIDGYSDAAVEVEAGSDTFAAPSISLGETDDFKFQQGELMFSLDGGARFAGIGGVTVEVRDQEGTLVLPQTGRIELGTPRVDIRGNLIVPVLSRDQTDSLSVAVIVSGATVSDYLSFDPDDEMWTSVSCTALAGYRADQAQKIAYFVAP